MDETCLTAMENWKARDIGVKQNTQMLYIVN